jgi:hypothetical protein
MQTLGNSMRLSVQDRTAGINLPIYLYRGEYWVAGQPGHSYALNLASNTGGRRILATTSVDGVNIVSGETAGVVQRGYVLSPYQSYQVSGWRKSDHEVAQFNFASVGTSYAAQTGRPANVGVIGVAVFPEYMPPPPVYVPPPVVSPPVMSPAPAAAKPQMDGMASRAPSEKTAETSVTANVGAATMGRAEGRADALGDSSVAESAKMKKESASARGNMPSGVAPAPTVAQGIGTGHGARESSYAPTVAFKRESNSPSEVITLRYDTAENLVARGVLQWRVHHPHPVHPPVVRPQPFPDARQGFVPDPPRQ